MPPSPATSLVILYEHAPLVEALAARVRDVGVAVDLVDIRDAAKADGEPALPEGVFVNRIGAYPTGGGDPEIVLDARRMLERLEDQGRRVLNGAFSYYVATSKLRQSELVEGLGLETPRARAIRDFGTIAQDVEELEYPLIFKPNVGGSGVGIVVLHGAKDLEQLAHSPRSRLGADGTGILQEYHVPRDGVLVRIEILDGELLYATRQPVVQGQFNYCARGGCHAADGEIEVFDPPPSVAEDACRVLSAARADFGAVEYVESARDGARYWFDVNPFSNYLEDVERIGFDPFDRLARFLVKVASAGG
jgi:hypothetical protein